MSEQEQVEQQPEVASKNDAPAEDVSWKAPDQKPVLSFKNVQKTFRIPVLHTFNPKEWKTKGYRLKVEAVRDVTMDVFPGEIFGFLGPNGAGKSTAIKISMGLIKPTSGSVSLFDTPVWDMPPNTSAALRWFARYQPGDLLKRVGYLPEHPYYYDFLRPQELLEFFAQLHNIPKSVYRKRIDELLEQVGLSHARERVLRKFSKGMLQRIGIASCLINDPELIILDEPLSGLDPIGRKEMRDLIFELKKRGKTIFFSSHILHDIELICDRVAFIVGGKLREVGTLNELQNREQQIAELLFSGISEEFNAAVGEQVKELEAIGQNTHCLADEARVEEILKAAFEHKLRVVSVIPRKKTLEELFITEAKRKEGATR